MAHFNSTADIIEAANVHGCVEIRCNVHLHTQASALRHQVEWQDQDLEEVDFTTAPYWLIQPYDAPWPVKDASDYELASAFKLVETSLTATLRDQFAMAALTGFLGSEVITGEITGVYEPEDAARRAYEIAAAMLAERAKIHGGQDY